MSGQRQPETEAPHAARRVLHLIASNFYGGPEAQILTHAADMASRGWEIWIGSFRDAARPSEILEQAAAKGLRTLEVLSNHFNPFAGRELARLLRENRIELLCTHGYKANIVGRLAARRSGCRQVAFVRGWTAETWKVGLYEKLDRFVLKRTEWVVCVSQRQAEELNRVGRAVPARVIPNAMLLPESAPLDPQAKRALRERLGLPTAAFLVGCAGRLSVEKNQADLLRAVAAAAGQIPELHAVILGDGRERGALESLRDSLGLGDRVRFAGFQRPIAPWMQALDVLVNPSLTEGMPNAILEAMALGTPVVATRVGDVEEMLGGGSAGWLVEAGAPAEIAQALQALYRDPGRRAQLASAAQQRVKEYSLDRQRERMLALYSQALGLPQATEAGAQSPFLSVVIPVRNEEKHLGSVLDSLVAQEYPADRFEILVADGESTDRTPAVVTQYAERKRQPEIRLLPNPVRLSSAGRNVGARAGHGEIVLFVDGHCRIPSARLLADTARLMRETGADCLCRPQPLRLAHTTFQRAVMAARATWLGHGRDSLIYSDSVRGFVDPSSSGACYRRSVFQTIGYYDEHFDACEDVEFNHRVKSAGLRSYTDPCLQVEYEPRSTLAGLFRQMMRYGRGRLRLARKHPSALSLSQLVPALLVAGLLCGGLLAAAGVLRTVYFAAAGLYLLAVVLASLPLVRQGPAIALLAPAVLITVHLGLGAGFWSELWSQLLHPGAWKCDPEPHSTSKSSAGAGV